MRVRIVGTSLVGSSLGMAPTRARADVLPEDLSSSHARIAVGLGTGRVATDDEPVDATMMASSPAAIAGVVTRMLERHPEAVITDVRSAKFSITQAVTTASDRPERYVPGHPAVGSQLTRPLTASANLFTDYTWMITPQVGNSPEDVGLVHRLVRLCGACVVELDADSYDEIIAWVSHVLYLMSIPTASHLRGVPGENLVLMGQGTRDVTRVAGSDPGLWWQIITTNSAVIRREPNKVAADFEYLIGVLNQAESLEAPLVLGQYGTMALRGKHGQASKELAVVTVEVPGEPRVLIRLFGDVGDSGLNVEDFELTHDAVQEVGYLSISVERPQAERFREDLGLRSWRAWLNWEGT